MNNKLRIILIFSVFYFAVSVGTAFCSEIAVIKSQDLPIYQQALDGFKKIYRGKVSEYDLKGRPDESADIIIALKKDPPDLILTIGLYAARMAKENFSQTPVVYCMVYDPLRLSLSGGNITGVSLETNPMDTFMRIKDFFPSSKRIGVLFDPVKSGKTVNQAMIAAQRSGLTLIAEEVTSEKQIPDALRAIQHKIDLLWMIPDSTVVTAESIDFIFLTALENNTPVISFSDEMVRKGAVMAILPDYHSVGEQAGRLAIDILRGKSPAKIPVTLSEKIRTLINPGIAKKIGIEINADHVRSTKSYRIELYTPETNVGKIQRQSNTKKIYE
ncbi:MAG: ABC transporter substrate-binding protein [Nitrospirae bacterium]|nr:ABC transporter substrate-binding protein [Nitrospirota bacterium]